MMNDYVFTADAEAGLESIFIYGKETWGFTQAKKYLTNLLEKIELLAEMPTIGKRHPEIDEGLYSFPCQRHMIYYFYIDARLIVMAILHEKSLPDNHLQNRTIS